MQELKEPEGVAFFSVQTGETHYGKLEPTIQAYINSSDMGINASRGQDFGWRLAPEWVKRVREFKRDRMQMAILTARHEGRKPTTVQILYYLYGQDLEEYYESQEEGENPFEAQYMAALAAGSTPAQARENAGIPAALADFRETISEGEDDLSDLIDDAIDDEEETTTPEPETPAAEEPAKPAAKRGRGRPPKNAK